MIAVLAAIVASVAAGATVGHRAPEAAARWNAALLRALLYGALPLITFFVLARLDLGGGVGIGLLLGIVERATGGVLAYLVATRVLHAPRPVVGSVVVGVIVVNTGYLGVPLNATLLGTDAVAPAVAWDVVVSGVSLYLAGFAVGAAFGTSVGDGRQEQLTAFLTRNPPLWAAAAALVAPDVLAPDVLVGAAEIASILLLPVGFFVLGATLAVEADEGALPFPPPVTPPLVAILGVRLLVAPVIFAALVLVTGTRVPDAYRVQSGMACGINALVVAHAYGLDLRLSAAAIAWSTALVVPVAVVAGILS